MATSHELLGNTNLDGLLVNLEELRDIEELKDVAEAFLAGDYRAVLEHPAAKNVTRLYIGELEKQKSEEEFRQDSSDANEVLRIFLIGLAALNAFLQANVTGPPLPVSSMLDIDSEKESAGEAEVLDWRNIRKKCLASLEVDGVSVYQLIPHVELFCLARKIFTGYFPINTSGGREWDSKWMRIRVNFLHQRLLSGSKMGVNDAATKMQGLMEGDLRELERMVLGEVGGKDGGRQARFDTEAKVQFLLEKAQVHIAAGKDWKARENVGSAGEVAGFSYVLSGALGKRTRWQERDISQLVVLAKSGAKAKSGENGDSGATVVDAVKETTGPTALELNDDTLLESIQFSKAKISDGPVESDLPPELAELTPDNQPQLDPLDQITLLTEATIRDEFSPQDKLNSEEILPYAVRVLADKPTNWQIYTQALLVRSRIEAHRSRTQERSVLQLQAIVDQIIAETSESSQSSDSKDASTSSSNNDVPEIKITTFFPKAKAEDTAPITERLKYIYQLRSPTRWEVETELAYAWSSAGSFISALEIFKRLELWAEVSLCYASVGQEDKARQIVRRQLFYSSSGPEMDRYGVDADEVVKEKWDGEVREPAPPHAPRLWCILGDLDQDPECWERAWEVSGKRFARAQRTLGEYWTKKGDLGRAREHYIKATVVNRQNDETWARLGDIDLRVGNWDGAIIAFQQSIMIDDTDARTYSNLGSALASKHAEMMELKKLAPEAAAEAAKEMEIVGEAGGEVKQSPNDVLRQALQAFKKGATIAHTNWQIWDNVITIAGRMSPPAFTEILLSMRAIIRLRAPTIGEQAVDAQILGALINEVTSRDKPENAAQKGEVYLPARGTLARALIEMVENEIVPLITERVELWGLVEKVKLYRGDYEGALASAEKAWRLAMKGERWLEEEGEWSVVVMATEGLVSAYENYGEKEKVDGSGEVVRGWKGKARSVLRSAMGKARGVWEETEEWGRLEEGLEELKS